MLTITLLNIGGYEFSDMADYRAIVRVNDRIIWCGKIKGHDRSLGWIRLVLRLIDIVKEHPEWGDGK
jgi:hypothetical protein